MDYFNEKYFYVKSDNIKEILLLPHMSNNKLKTEDMFFLKYNNIQHEILLSFKYDYILKYKEFPGEKIKSI